MSIRASTTKNPVSCARRLAGWGPAGGRTSRAASPPSRVCRGDEVYFCDGGFGPTPGTYQEVKVLHERYLAHLHRGSMAPVSSSLLPCASSADTEVMLNGSRDVRDRAFVRAAGEDEPPEVVLASFEDRDTVRQPFLTAPPGAKPDRPVVVIRRGDPDVQTRCRGWRVAERFQDPGSLRMSRCDRSMARAEGNGRCDHRGRHEQRH